MEDTLRVASIALMIKSSTVLILVLMEDTLRVLGGIHCRVKRSLNPCFNGRYSQRAQFLHEEVKKTS